jgi:hypothetical protein
MLESHGGGDCDCDSDGAMGECLSVIRAWASRRGWLSGRLSASEGSGMLQPRCNVRHRLGGRTVETSTRHRVDDNIGRVVWIVHRSESVLAANHVMPLSAAATAHQRLSIFSHLISPVQVS